MKFLSWISLVLKMCSWLLDLITTCLICGNSVSYNGNKELAGFSAVVASVLQWAKLCVNFLLDCRLSEEVQVLQKIAA